MAESLLVSFLNAAEHLIDGDNAATAAASATTATPTTSGATATTGARGTTSFDICTAATLSRGLLW